MGSGKADGNAHCTYRYGFVYHGQVERRIYLSINITAASASASVGIELFLSHLQFIFLPPASGTSTARGSLGNGCRHSVFKLLTSHTRIRGESLRCPDEKKPSLLLLHMHTPITARSSHRHRTASLFRTLCGAYLFAMLPVPRVN